MPEINIIWWFEYKHPNHLKHVQKFPKRGRSAFRIRIGTRQYETAICPTSFFQKPFPVLTWLELMDVEFTDFKFLELMPLLKNLYYRSPLPKVPAQLCRLPNVVKLTLEPEKVPLILYPTARLWPIPGEPKREKPLPAQLQIRCLENFICYAAVGLSCSQAVVNAIITTTGLNYFKYNRVFYQPSK